MKARILPLFAVAVLAAGCSSGGTTASSAPAKVHLDAKNLVSSGKLLMCAEIDSPPQEFLDAHNKPTGSDVDTGNAIAAQLGLKAVWVNAAFDTIIASVKSGKCDIVLSGQFITPARQEQVTMIPYITAGQGLLVKKRNPDHISVTNLMTLCGKTVVLLQGAVEGDTVKAASSACSKAGKAAIKTVVTENQSDMVQQMLTGYAQAIFHDTPIDAYWAKQYANRLEMVPGSIDPFVVGISVPKNKPALASAIATALKNIESDGTYNKIRSKWGLLRTRVPAPRY